MSALIRSRAFLLLVVAIAVVLSIWTVLALNCPNAGIALTERARNLHRLKNRTKLPELADFEPGITLESLLRSGDDRNRWTNQRAARLQGEVIDVAYARPEAANCFNPCRRDVHILIAKEKNAAKREQVVLEISPLLMDLVASEGGDWSEPSLQAKLVGHWCEFEGWLYFDVGHAAEAENTAAGNPENWRATAWEIHPVTNITVIR